MIRVLQILSGLNRGGMETFIMNVYRTIDRTKIQFDFLVTSEGGDYYKEIYDLGGTVFCVPSRREGYVKYIKALNTFFRSNAGHYAAVHYHESSLTSLEPLFFAKKYGIKNRLIHSHNSSIKGNKLHLITHLIGKVFVKTLATNYLGCSDKAIEWMYAGSGIKNKAELIKNGINTNEFRFDRDKRKLIRAELCLTNKIVIGHVGRFMEVKNHTFLLQIFKSLYKINSNCHLLLIGTGELESKIENLATDMGLIEKVSFLGVRKDINDLMQAMDVFVMPSLYEGLPVVLVEAQTSGLPIICTDTISLMSRLTQTYYTCSLNDTPDVWAKTIQKALNADSNRNEAVNKIKTAGFDIHSTTQRLMDLYNL